MKSYLIFGIESDDLRAARSLVDLALGIRMELHESGYRGGEYYRLGDVGDEHFILQKNFDEVEGEWAEPNCEDCGLILYANETNRAAQIQEALLGVAKLVSCQEF